MANLVYRSKEGGPPRKLTDIVQRCNELVDAAAESYASKGTDFMLDAIKTNMPESHDPGVPGFDWTAGGDGVHMRDEAHRTDVKVDGDIWEASAGTDKPYAPYVDQGTGLYGPSHAKYLIEPNTPGGTLRFAMNGHLVFASHVWHPGSPGSHFMMKGMYATKAGVRIWRVEGDSIFKRGMANG